LKKKKTAVVQRVVKSQKNVKFCHNDHSFQEVHETKENLPLYLSKEVS